MKELFTLKNVRLAAEMSNEDQRKIMKIKSPDILECLLDESCLMPKMFSFEEVREVLKRVKQDLLAVADAGEMEDLRREIERYFL